MVPMPIPNACRPRRYQIRSFRDDEVFLPRNHHLDHPRPQTPPASAPQLRRGWPRATHDNIVQSSPSPPAGLA